MITGNYNPSVLWTFPNLCWNIASPLIFGSKAGITLHDNKKKGGGWVPATYVFKKMSISVSWPERCRKYFQTWSNLWPHLVLCLTAHGACCKHFPPALMVASSDHVSSTLYQLHSWVFNKLTENSSWKFIFFFFITLPNLKKAISLKSSWNLPSGLPWDLR